MSSSLQSIIDAAWEDRAKFSPADAPADVRAAVSSVIEDLNAGRVRVATREGVGQWTVHQWVKKAVLLSFRLNDNKPMHAGALQYFDKVEPKFAHLDEAELRATGVRIVPPAVARHGSFIGRNAVLMPSYVNIGAYVDEGTMVDTWVTVGSCAQIGKNVHLSGGVGIGGVLEPPQAKPVVVEDDCFVGSRCMIVNGARVRAGAKVGAGVILTDTTPVIEADTGEEIARGVIPERAIVVQGTRMKEFAGGTFGLPCALILRYLDEGEEHDRLKLNAILREHGVVS